MMLLVLLAAAPLSWGEGRQAFVDVGAIAEVTPSEAGAAAVRGLDPKATVTQSSPRVSLWTLSGTNAAAVLAALDAKLPGHFAAVFHDEKSAASKTRVPAGGVLVWLEPSTNPEAWAARKKLVLKQNFGNGTLLLDSAPGAATLALAASLRSDSKVKTVMPSWWLRAVRK